MNKYTLLLILPVFLGMISCKKQGPSGPEPLVLEPGQLKVMSFNIRSVTNESEALNNWCMRGQACRMVVEYEQPSIVGFQELAEEQWAYMKGTLAGKGYAGVGDDRDCRNSCLYRPDLLELGDNGMFWLSDTPEISSNCWDGYVRTCQWAKLTVKATGEVFFFVNTHLGLTSDSRSKGMRLIVKRIGQYNPENLPVVLMADFNTHSADAIFDTIRETMVCTRDVAPITDDVKTYNAWGEKARAYICDHIWISAGMECSEYKTVTYPYDGHTYVSDHYPVYSIIKF